jgi:predicted nucleic acid-binding protein
MVILVLDASVILKWFLEEDYSDIAIKIREDFYNEIHQIVEPDFLLYEFTNVLRYHPAYKTEDINRALNSLIESELDIVLPTLDLLKTAIDLAKKYDITIYDAIYVALAELIEGVFVTVDKKLYDKIKKLKFVKFVTEFK